MDASIIVCSYNRADSLSQTLTALRQQHVNPEITWEVIIVDNNSNDHTREVVENAQRKWPELHYTLEPQQGLSHARNHGIKYASGDILLFTDDDVLPESEWLKTTLIGMEEYQADAHVRIIIELISFKYGCRTNNRICISYLSISRFRKGQILFYDKSY